MCKAIALNNSIQNHLLSLLSKYQGWVTVWIANFNDYPNGKLFFYTFYMWRFCALTAFWKSFLSVWCSRYTWLCACTERLHRDFSAHHLLLQWHGCLYRRALFSSLCLFIDSRLFGEFRKFRCFVLMLNLSYKLHYVFGKNTDRKHV